MRRLISILFFAFTVSWSYGQELTLDSCQSMARKNHPLLRQSGIIDQISELRQQNIQVSNLPQFDLTARASWQSDVTKLALNVPGFAGPEPLSKDQYKAYVDIRQKLFDGGAAKKRGSPVDSKETVCICVWSGRVWSSRFKYARQQFCRLVYGCGRIIVEHMGLAQNTS